MYINKKLGFLLLLLIGFSCSKDELDQSSDAKLLSFSIEELDNDFTINSDNSITAKVDSETDLSSLTPVFTISENAILFKGTKVQTSGFTKNNFNDAVIYTVKAEDGTQNNYTINITKDGKILSFKLIELPDINFEIDNLSITAKVPKGTTLTNLTAKFSLTDKAQLFVGSTLQDSEQTKNNFDEPLKYTLKDASDESKVYIVTINEEENIAPIADAGLDQIHVLLASETSKKITLSASNSSDADGEISEYKWHEGSTLLGEGETLEVDLSLGIHTVTLTVEDDFGLTHTDEVIITLQVMGTYAPIDPNASQLTKNLLTNLAKIAISDEFIFGQEFPMSFKLDGTRNDLSTSDSKEVSGDHPGVYGIDPHYMIYKSAQQRQLIIDEAKYAYNNGAVVTFDFHQQSKNDRSIYMQNITNPLDKSLMYDVVNDLNGSREWFYGEMDEVIGIVNNDLNFPIVWRLYHEMDGDWFWWGSAATNHSKQLYIDFYKLAVDYIKNKTDLVLFAWSPNSGFDTAYYPGDDYVDIVGVDIYDSNGNNIQQNLIELTKFSLNHNKVAVLSEVGRNNFISNDPDFWSDTILKSIKDAGSSIKIAWALAWFNAPWKSSQDDLFIPNSQSSTTIKNDFIEFKNDSKTLFLEDVKLLKMYNE